MASQQIQNMTAGLPYSLKESVNGYVDAVAAAISDIAKEARVDIQGERLDQFLLIVAIRRIWSFVNSQYWIMADCIGAATRTETRAEGAIQVRGFRVGRDEISQDSRPFLEGRHLRETLQQLMTQLRIEELVIEANSLSEIAHKMFAESD
ncbi:hypothetical protein [Mesorhizobium sp. 1M-11]|uniref:hypothetical protein n=1 Tax=Mesorhizobium sp. 1M-11 TaxID=1529006 RepID=UPI0006C7388C|nr:hypothetical protein [Mesorhizobium sp. 1M-11]